MVTLSVAATSLTEAVRIEDYSVFKAALTLVGMAGFLTLVFVICMSVPYPQNRPHTPDDWRRSQAIQVNE